MKRVKEKIHSALHRMGVDVIRHRASATGSNYSIIDVRRCKLLAKLGIDVLLDVGANSGQYALGVRKAGYGGRIISFEPTLVAFNELTNTRGNDPLWDIHRVGLGLNNATATINIAGNNAESSSLLGMCARHLEEAPSAAYVSKETISIETLDGLGATLFQPTDRLWLKLDVQGYEFPILEGGRQMMKQVIGLEVELSLVQLYEGQPLLRDSLERIEAIGFQLIGVEEVFTDSAGLRTLQLNGVFERTTSNF